MAAAIILFSFFIVLIGPFVGLLVSFIKKQQKVRIGLLLAVYWPVLLWVAYIIFIGIASKYCPRGDAPASYPEGCYILGINASDHLNAATGQGIGLGFALIYTICGGVFWAAYELVARILHRASSD
ncbi:hypothetical protein [Pseudovibrio sp. SCP19]|uniref:hypothetical protein n=1 Tax=Pseudovibrio sp. SCP19 TaxID=3141374 RepID=UPI00333DE850